jgi:hypothetical protein
MLKEERDILWGYVVDATLDPLKLGRVKVRVPFKYSSSIPIDDLPWASVADNVGKLSVRDTVMVFFADGSQTAQYPVVISKIPGLRQGILTSTIPLAEEYYRLTPAQQKTLESFPRPAVNYYQTGYPERPLLSQGIVDGTALGNANNNRAHVCDIRQAMKKEAALARIKFSGIVTKIRNAIRAVLKKLGLLPDSESSKFLALATAIIRTIRFIQEGIDFIRDVSQALIDYVRYVRAMIDWITNLPKKLAAFLAQCLTEFLSALAGTVSDIFSASGVPGDKSISDSINAIQGIALAGKELFQSATELAQVPAQLVTAITTPASQDDVNKVSNDVNNFVSLFSSQTENTSNKKMP